MYFSEIIHYNAKLRIYYILAIKCDSNKNGVIECDRCLLCCAAFWKYEAYKYKKLNIISLKILKSKKNQLILKHFDFGCKLILLRCSFVFCSKKIKKLTRCKGCRFNAYCSRTCQKQDWKFIHSTMCEKSTNPTFFN